MRTDERLEQARELILRTRREGEFIPDDRIEELMALEDAFLILCLNQGFDLADREVIRSLTQSLATAYRLGVEDRGDIPSAFDEEFDGRL
jgi:hypothetical protein